MKRFSALLLTLTLHFALSACGQSAGNSSTPSQTDESSESSNLADTGSDDTEGTSSEPIDAGTSAANDSGDKG